MGPGWVRVHVLLRGQHVSLPWGVPRLLSPFTSLILVYNYSQTPCVQCIEVSLARASLPRVVLAAVAVGDVVVWLCWLGLSVPSQPLSTAPSFLCAAGAGGEIWGPEGLSGARHQPSSSWEPAPRARFSAPLPGLKS